MIPRSTFGKIRANQMPDNSQSGRGLRALLALVLAAGIMIAGSVKLLAQDVPPPPPDAQDQQQPQDNSGQVLPQYGPPAPSDNSANYPQQQQSYPPPQQNYPQQNYPQQQQQMPPVQQGQPQGQPMSPDQLDQLVAPIALYPDALVAQVLAASTYPTQVVEANQWRQSQGNASPDQIAAGANAQNWDPSVKALTAFPSVLSQMNSNMQWTTDLGNAYYNQPQDVMDAVQQMRQRAEQAGTLQNTPQQTVAQDNGSIEIAPANPDLVYVPVYNPWLAYGPAVVAWPGYYYAPPPGFFIGVGYGFRLGFAWGIPLRAWAPWGWGFHNWGVGWYNRTVVYNRTTFITRSTTVINRGFNRPGGPPVQLAGTRGSFMNRPQYAGYAHNVAAGARPAPNGFAGRPAGTQPGFNRPSTPTNGFANGNNGARPGVGYSLGNGPRPTYAPGQQNYDRSNPGAAPYRPSTGQTSGYDRPAQTYRPPQQNYSRPQSAPAQHNSAPKPAPAQHAAPHSGGEGSHHQ